MNILLTNAKGLGHGGAEISIMLIARELQKRGHNVILASSANFEGIRVERFKNVDKYPYFLQHAYLKKFFIKLIKKYSIDIINPQDNITTIPAIKSAKICSIPSVVNFRSYWFACPISSCLRPNYSICVHCNWKRLLFCAKWSRYFIDLYKWQNLKGASKILETANLKLVVSDSLKNRLAACGIKTNVQKILPPRKLEQFEISKEETIQFKEKYGLRKTVISFIGSFFYTKGILQLFKFMPEILRDNPDVSFLLVGNGPQYNEIKKIIAAEGLEDQIILTGWLPFEKIPVCYAISDIVLIPHLWDEPFGAIVMEAAASSKPSIVSERGGPGEFKDDFGFTLPPDDTELWKEKTIYLLKNPEARELIGKNAKKNIGHFSIEGYIVTIEQLYSELIDKNKS